jgi:hypothetical protein
MRVHSAFEKDYSKLFTAPQKIDSELVHRAFANPRTM